MNDSHKVRLHGAVSCIKNPDDMADILIRDYSDAPVRGIPPWLIRSFAEKWKKRDEVHFLKIEHEGRYAGFVFGHTFGPRPWRHLLAGSVWSLPLMTAVWLKRKFGRMINSIRRCGDAGVPPNLPALATAPAGLVCSDESFAMLEFLFVKSEFRGLSLSQVLLERFQQDVFSRGTKMMQAHISPWNTPSIRSFHSAGWSIYSAGLGSLRAFKTVPKFPPQSRQTLVKEVDPTRKHSLEHGYQEVGPYRSV